MRVGIIWSVTPFFSASCKQSWYHQRHCMCVIFHAYCNIVKLFREKIVRLTSARFPNQKFSRSSSALSFIRYTKWLADWTMIVRKKKVKESPVSYFIWNKCAPSLVSNAISKKSTFSQSFRHKLAMVQLLFRRSFWNFQDFYLTSFIRWKTKYGLSNPTHGCLYSSCITCVTDRFCRKPEVI